MTRRIKSYDDVEDFVDAAYLYFESNPKLTWKQFCDGLKDMDNTRRERK